MESRIFWQRNALTRVVLYELVLGRRAFGGEIAIQALSSVLRDEPRALEVCFANTPNVRDSSGQTLLLQTERRRLASG